MKCKVFERNQRKKHIKNNDLYRWQEYNEKKIRNRLRENVLNVLNKSSQTVYDICNVLMADEFEIISVIGDLESIGKVEQTSWKSFYRSCGDVAFLAVYGCVKSRVVESITHS